MKTCSCSMLPALACAAVLVAGATLVAHAQPEKAPATPTPATPTTEANMAEAPDGTKMPVVATSQIALVMEDLKVGDGAVATPSSTITIHYHGTLKDGKEFDSTRGKEAATFPLNRLIQGWQLGIPGMKVGGIRRLTVPWQLAYGERGSGPIPAKADLTFSIQLLGVR